MLEEAEVVGGKAATAEAKGEESGASSVGKAAQERDKLCIIFNLVRAPD